MQPINHLMQRLALEHPIIQAPMAGGGDTPALVSSVCKAGALGSLGAAYLTSSQISDASRQICTQTSHSVVADWPRG